MFWTSPGSSRHIHNNRRIKIAQDRDPSLLSALARIFVTSVSIELKKFTMQRTGLTSKRMQASFVFLTSCAEPSASKETTVVSLSFASLLLDMPGIRS